MPRQGRKVGVPDDNAAASLQGPVYGGQRSSGIGNVLEDLDADSGIECGVFNSWPVSRALTERRIGAALATPSGQSEHVGAGVDPDDRTACAYLFDEFGFVEPRSAAHVQD